MAARYFHEHHGVERIAGKTRRMKNAPPLRRDAHHRDALRLMPAAMCGSAALVIDDVRHQQVVHVAAVAGHVDHFVAFDTSFSVAAWLSFTPS